jgi:NAD-dependent SIR2 family protein deacetylase
MGNNNNKVEHTNKYQEIVEGLKNNQFKEIMFITGAGISTAAGIPDFRSKDGCFAQVQKKYNLSYPEELFQLSSFKLNPAPFYDFCKGFNIDGCKPTKTHLFMGYLCTKGILKKIYTQNVDGLELKAGVPLDKIVFAHGKITEAACPSCWKSYDINVLRDEYVMKDKIMYCTICKTPIKPKVIFYGESLPLKFYLNYLFIPGCDLAFIMGSSLRVSPFNQLPGKVSSGAWRVFVNKEEVDDVFDFENTYSKDLFLEGYTDEIVEKLVKDVGWEDDFNNYCENILTNLK